MRTRESLVMLADTTVGLGLLAVLVASVIPYPYFTRKLNAGNPLVERFLVLKQGVEDLVPKRP